MLKIQQCLKSKQGEMLIRACILILIILMVFSMLFYYSMATVLAKGQRNGAMQALDQYTQLNAIDIYNSIKHCDDETNALDPSVFISELCLTQGLELSGDAYVARSTDGAKQYEVSDITMTFAVENTTKIQVKYTLTVPLRFLGIVRWVDIPVTITTGLNPKFDLPAA